MAILHETDAGDSGHIGEGCRPSNGCFSCCCNSLEANRSSKMHSLTSSRNMASVLQLCCAACESQDWICLVHYICRAMSDSSSSVRLSSYAVLVACGQLIAALYWLLPCDGGFSFPITTSKVLECSKLPKRPGTHFTNPTAFFFRVILFLFLVQHQRS